MTIVRPETVVRWHRAGFRAYWRWKSRNPGGGPRIAAELRALIRRMSIENWLWSAPHIHEIVSMQASLLACGLRLSSLLRRTEEMQWLHPLRLIVISCGFIATAAPAHAASLNPEEAASYAGTNATVCGLIASGNYAASSPTQPTFLDFSKPYPNETFSAVILGDDRKKFGTPEISLREKYVCVTGEIVLYQGKPQIILRDPEQLSDK